MEDTLTTHDNLTELTAQIVSAYVSNNAVTAESLPALIGHVYSALAGITVSVELAAAPQEPLVPAVSIKKSVQPDHIVCLEDGMKFKSLKRHLQAAYGMSPDDYRKKWGLPGDYPMVAPAYAASRSNLAKQMGLGKVRYNGVGGRA